MKLYSLLLSVLCVTMSLLAMPKTAAQQEQLLEALRCRWSLHARTSQREPAGNWDIWAIITGRGWGKTRTAGETIRQWVESGQYSRLHLVAATAADARDTMVEGESGILAISPPWCKPNYEPSKRRLTWPNGATATLFSAEEPDRLRGPQCDAWWADELAAWTHIAETWDMLQLGARLGSHVRGVITTTPRPLPLLKDILKRPTTHVTRGSTFENEQNLARSFMAAIKERYEGTRLGRQEIGGEILEDNPDALWTRELIERTRVTRIPEEVKPIRVVVALDPSATSTGDEAGIVVVVKGSDNRVYVTDDLSLQAAPIDWARAAVTAYHKHHADRLVYEANMGGEMVKQTLRIVDHTIATKSVTATRGKVVRAEPIAALYEQGRVSHVGCFPKLEDELCEWTPGTKESPNRLDALVWGITEIHGKREPGKVVLR
jgi:phage terminase large subunit-like protein